MDSLFGIPLTSILFGLLILLALSLSVVGWVALRQPILFRMGIRNLGRRRAQTTLIVVGLTLSTLIISAAFTTGDTVGYSITSGVYDTFERVDIAVAHDPALASEGSPHYLTDDFLAELRGSSRPTPTSTPSPGSSAAISPSSTSGSASRSRAPPSSASIRRRSTRSAPSATATARA